MSNTQIRLIEKDTILPEKMKPLDWDLVIKGIPYYVVRIEGYVHSIGGKWGDNDLWAYPRNEKPSYENLIEFDANEPVSWGIIYNPLFYISHKYDESEVRRVSRPKITRNGKIFCDVIGSINKALALIDDLQEHPMDLNSIDFDKKVIGRKVWWRSEPGIITDYIDGQACVMIEPDGIDHFTTPAEFEKEEGDNYYCDGDVKTSIFDKHIWWFRED